MADLFYTTTLKIYRRIRRKINSKSHAREILSLITKVPVDFGFGKVPIKCSKIYLTLRYKLRHFHGRKSYGNKSRLMSSREFSQLLHNNNKLTVTI